jgi:hypothetical protein
MKGNWVKTSLYVLLLIVGFIISACNNKTSEKQTMLAGKWKFKKVLSESSSPEAQKAANDMNQISQGLQYNFTKDGNLSIQQNDNQMARKYRLIDKNNILIMENGSSQEAYHIEKLSTTELAIKDAHGTIVTFSR